METTHQRLEDRVYCPEFYAALAAYVSIATDVSFDLAYSCLCDGSLFERPDGQFHGEKETYQAWRTEAIQTAAIVDGNPYFDFSLEG